MTTRVDEIRKVIYKPDWVQDDIDYLLKENQRLREALQDIANVGYGEIDPDPLNCWIMCDSIAEKALQPKEDTPCEPKEAPQGGNPK